MYAHCMYACTLSHTPGKRFIIIYVSDHVTLSTPYMRALQTNAMPSSKVAIYSSEALTLSLPPTTMIPCLLGALTVHPCP